jgi:hypothetical protein
MSVKNSVRPLALSSIDSATFTGAYQLLSPTSGISNPAFYIKIVNNSSVAVTVSYDGTNDHDFVRAGSDAPINFQTNSQPTNNNALLAQFTKIYVKAAAGTGLVYISGWYQQSGQMGV